VHSNPTKTHTDKKTIEIYFLFIILMDEFAKLFEQLDKQSKTTLLKLSIINPSTESIKKDIDRSQKINDKQQSVQLEYECNDKCSFTNIYKAINENPIFNQMDTRRILIDMVKELDDNQSEFDLKQVDYLLFQRTKMPILCLKNITNQDIKIYNGVSSFLEINDFRSNYFYKYDYKNMNRSLKTNYNIDITKIIGVTTLVTSTSLCLYRTITWLMNQSQK